MKVITINVEDIDASGRLRKIDADYAALIAEGFKASGQRQPIEVRKQDATGRYRLIAGAHRLAAAKINKAKTILAVEMDVTEDQAALLEIDENLFRHDLTVLDRGAFLARRKALYLKIYPATEWGGDRRSDQARKFADLKIANFTKETADRLGVSDATINRAIALFNNIKPPVREMLAGTKFANKGVDLATIGSIGDESNQLLAAEMLVKGTAKTAADAKAAATNTEKPATDESEKDFKTFTLKWSGTKRYSLKTKKLIIKFLVEQGEVLYLPETGG